MKHKRYSYQEIPRILGKQKKHKYFSHNGHLSFNVPIFKILLFTLNSHETASESATQTVPSMQLRCELPEATGS